MILNKDLPIIAEKFRKASKVVITAHTNPDGDAIGSALGMYHAAIESGKDAVVLLDSPVPYNLKNLPGAENIIVFNPEKHYEYLVMADIIFILDLNDPKRLKSLEKFVTGSLVTKVLIDHHLDPEKFANHYFIDTEATSTGELIYKLLNNELAIPISDKIAANLYMAIMTDTGSFRFQRTDAEIHIIVADLIQAGADPVKLYDDFYNNNTINATRLLGNALSKLELWFDGKVVVMPISRSMIINCGATNEDIDNFIERTLSIQGAQLGILLAEMLDRDEVRMSFRSKGEISAREVAVHFGGGGHFHASGARIFNEDIENAKAKVKKYLATIF